VTEEEIIRLRSYLATQSVLQANPDAHLDSIWKHFELGETHWREWLLFARVHLLDHMRQSNQGQIFAE